MGECSIVLLSPYLSCIIELPGVCFTVWPMSLGMMLSNHCQCENISEDEKEKYVAEKLVYYIWIKTFFIVVLTLLYKNENGKNIPLNSLSSFSFSFLPFPEMLVSTATLDIRLWL